MIFERVTAPKMWIEEMEDDDENEMEDDDENEMEEDDDDDMDDEEDDEGGILGLDLGFGLGEKDDD